MLEEYDKQQTEKEHPVPESPQPTLKDILADQEKSEYFGNFLDKQGLGMLGVGIGSRDLDPGDIEALSEPLKNFNKAMERASEIGELITPEAFQIFARNNPGCAQLEQMIGPEAAASTYKKKLAGLSVSNPEMFNDLSAAFKRQDDFVSGRGKRLEEQINQYCSDHNIKESSLLQAYGINDEQERKKAIRDAVRDGYNWFQKTGDFISAGSFSKKKIEYINDGKVAIDTYRKRLNNYRGSIGEILAATADQDPEVRKAFSEVLNGEQIRNNTGGFQEMKSRIPTEQSFREAWNEYKKKQKNVNWQTMSQADRDSHIDQFVEQQKAANRKIGFWGCIFDVIFDLFSNNNKANLS